MSSHWHNQHRPAPGQQRHWHGQAVSDLLYSWVDGVLEGHEDILQIDLDQEFLQEVLLEAGSSTAAELSCAVHAVHDPPAIAAQPGASSSSSACSASDANQQELHHPLLEAEEGLDIFDAFDAFILAEHEREHKGSCPSDVQQQQQQQQQQQVYSNSTGGFSPLAQDLYSHSSLGLYNDTDILGSAHAAAAAQSFATPAATTAQPLPLGLIQQQQQQQQQPWRQLRGELSGLQADQPWVPNQPYIAAAAAAALPAPAANAAASSSAAEPCCSTSSSGSGAAVHHSPNALWTGCSSATATPAVSPLHSPSLQQQQEEQQLLQLQQESRQRQLLQLQLQLEWRRQQLLLLAEQQQQLMRQQQQQQQQQQIRQQQVQQQQLALREPDSELGQRRALLQQQHVQRQLQGLSQQQQQQCQASIQLRQQISLPVRQGSSGQAGSQLQRQGSSGQAGSQVFARRRAFNPLTPNTLLKIKAQSKVNRAILALKVQEQQLIAVKKQGMARINNRSQHTQLRLRPSALQLPQQAVAGPLLPQCSRQGSPRVSVTPQGPGGVARLPQVYAQQQALAGAAANAAGVGSLY
uniref:Uncharacterized protein n=1 Tax=Tetradesmus obliquus TaxID=3088 RepID=A0A383V5C3_TETOB|eukprot:jgi/Sobl393_1/352/SZX60140.1